MNIIIGLGNPGEQYKNTRHNVGFMAIDKFAEENNFPEFKLQKKFGAEISETENIILAKPQIFMNESGKSVQKIIKNKEVKDIIIIHDDVDLPVGKIKIVKERGSAGHKGVESIIKSVGNENLIRIRIGIAPEKEIEAQKIVLKNFSPEEKNAISDAIQKTIQAIETLISEGLEKAMNQFN
jgi:PTH1 family peptidyl-tRNA hydrolase